MTDDAGDFRVHQLLRHGIANLGVFLIVLCQQFERGFLAADPDFCRVGFLHREARAVLVVLAEVSDAAGERSHAADRDREGRGSLRLLVFAAGANANHGRNRENAEMGADHGSLRSTFAAPGPARRTPS